jgi:predicted secreted hydrolase
MDRQWGPLDGWLLNRSNAGLRPLGWDWFGLSFDSGEDLLVTRHFRPGEPGWREGFALLFDGTGAARVGDGLEACTVKTWQSPRTSIVYPVQQRLRLPALDGEIEVVPLVEDQEVPVFGLPALWQGAVRAEGRIGLRRVSGTGRLELFGYGYAPSIRAYLLRAVRRMVAG